MCLSTWRSACSVFFGGFSPIPLGNIWLLPAKCSTLFFSFYWLFGFFFLLKTLEIAAKQERCGLASKLWEERTWRRYKESSCTCIFQHSHHIHLHTSMVMKHMDLFVQKHNTLKKTPLFSVANMQKTS